MLLLLLLLLEFRKKQTSAILLKNFEWQEGLGIAMTKN